VEVVIIAESHEVLVRSVEREGDVEVFFSLLAVSSMSLFLKVV
jgi:hypothetical protein